MNDPQYKIHAYPSDGETVTRYAETREEADQIEKDLREEFAGRLSPLGDGGVRQYYLYDGAWHPGRFWWGRH